MLEMGMRQNVNLAAKWSRDVAMSQSTMAEINAAILTLYANAVVSAKEANLGRQLNPREVAGCCKFVQDALENSLHLITGECARLRGISAESEELDDGNDGSKRIVLPNDTKIIL